MKYSSIEDAKSPEIGPGQSSIWCLIANVMREPHAEGPDGETRLGTKRFAPGAKLYCFPPRWGDGGARLRVLGRHRGGGPRLIDAVVATKHLVNWRAQQVFHPHVIQAMRGYWDYSEKSEREAKELAEAFNGRLAH
jgi:hypothetical protein